MVSEQPVQVANCGEIEIVYEMFGVDDDPTLVLISGRGHPSVRRHPSLR
ncbi:MAG: hypothetical protein QM650_14155 [Microlunatus sp.]